MTNKCLNPTMHKPECECGNSLKHTPEPWAYQKVKQHFDITYTNPQWDDTSLATTFYAGNEQQEEANANRIVQCVNACAGIPGPEAIPEVIAALKCAIEDPQGNKANQRYYVQALAKLEGKA